MSQRRIAEVNSFEPRSGDPRQLWANQASYKGMGLGISMFLCHKLGGRLQLCRNRNQGLTASFSVKVNVPKRLEIKSE